MRGHEDLQVVVDGGVVGRVRLSEAGGDLVVHEAELTTADRPDHADHARYVAVLGSLLECRAIANGAEAVVLDGGDPGAPGGPGVLGALAGSGWAEVVSERLRLDLEQEPAPHPDETGVRLVPMGAEAFEAFRERLTAGYVAERAASGESPEQARRTMTDQVGSLLPHGAASPDQHLLTGWDGDRVVGHLWLGTERDGAFVHLVEVAEEERRRGYGSALMRAVERWAREHDRDHVWLDVFAHNAAARSLYAGLGYRATRTTYRHPVAG